MAALLQEKGNINAQSWSHAIHSAIGDDWQRVGLRQLSGMLVLVYIRSNLLVCFPLLHSRSLRAAADTLAETLGGCARLARLRFTGVISQPSGYLCCDKSCLMPSAQTPCATGVPRLVGGQECLRMASVVLKTVKRAFPQAFPLTHGSGRAFPAAARRRTRGR